MSQFQIQLTKDQSTALRRMAADRNTSVAELIHQSIDHLIQESGYTDMAERRRRAIRAAGRFKSGQHDIAERHDDYLDEIYAS